MFRFGWLDAYRRAIHRCILGSDESHSILSARLPLTLPIRSLSLNRFKPGIHCSSATRLPILSLVPSSLTESIFPRSLSTAPARFHSFTQPPRRDLRSSPRTLVPRLFRWGNEGIHAQTRNGQESRQGPTYIATYRFLARTVARGRAIPRGAAAPCRVIVSPALPTTLRVLHRVSYLHVKRSLVIFASTLPYPSFLLATTFKAETLPYRFIFSSTDYDSFSLSLSLCSLASLRRK